MRSVKIIFVWLGTVLAWPLLLVGAMRFGVGVLVATAFSDPVAYADAIRRCLGSGTTGEAIDQGLVLFAACIVIGLLTRAAAKKEAS